MVSFAPSPWLTLAAACLGLGMLMVDMFVVVVALPAIARDLSADLAALEWTVTVYQLMLAVLPMGMGRLGDLLGRRRMYLAGLGLFVGASAACGLAHSMGALVVDRALQGAGAAVMTPLSLAIVSGAFPLARRGMAIGVWQGVSAIGIIAGPVLGGLLVHGDQWRWVFLVNVPLGAVAIVMALAFVPESRDESASRAVDWPGMLLLSTGLVLLLLGRLLPAALVLAAFVAVERRVSAPLVDLALFRDRGFVVACVAVLLFSAGVFGIQPHTSLFLQHAWGFTPLMAGLGVLPSTSFVAILMPFTGTLAQRAGRRLPALIVAGCLAGVASNLYLLLLRPDSGYADGLLPSFLLRGLAIGVVVPTTAFAVMAAAQGGKAGLASGTLTMSRNIGTAAGVALLGAIFLRHIDAAVLPEARAAARQFLGAPGAVLEGYRGMALASALLCAAAALAAAAMGIRRGPIARDEAPGT